MRVGLFLDFDGVLAPKAVNMQIATLLGVQSELVELEKSFVNGTISSADFGNSLAPLFRNAGFTRDFLNKNFENIQLDPFTVEVIQEFPNNTYIVTSSPNYFMERFCKKYNISSNRFICSKYEFDKDGKITKSKFPCGPREKESFVNRFIGDYDLTIGVGNSIEQDGPFMALCDISILMGEERRDHLSSSELYSVLNQVRRIKRRSETFIDGHNIPRDCHAGVKNLLSQSHYENNVFIITPFRLDARYNAVINTIKNTLTSNGLKGYLANDLTIAPGRDLWDNVRSFMHSCKYGIAILTAHEEEREDGIVFHPQIFNPNVMTEVGYMMGLSKNLLILKDERVQLPSDWLGKLYENMNFKNPEEQVQEAVTQWISEFRTTG